MKYVFLAFVVLALSLGAAASTINATWDYDYSKDNACIGAITTNCVTGFQLYALNKDGSRSVIATVTNPANATGPVAGISATGSFSKRYGLVTFYLVAIGKDDAGLSVESFPAQANGTVTPGAPTNLKFTLQ